MSDRRDRIIEAINYLKLSLIESLKQLEIQKNKFLSFPANKQKFIDQRLKSNKMRMERKSDTSGNNKAG